MGDLLELFQRGIVSNVPVGMILQRESSVRCLDFRLRGIDTHAKFAVKVALDVLRRDVRARKLPAVDDVARVASPFCAAVPPHARAVLRRLRHARIPTPRPCEKRQRSRAPQTVSRHCVGSPHALRRTRRTQRSNSSPPSQPQLAQQRSRHRSLLPATSSLRSRRPHSTIAPPTAPAPFPQPALLAPSRSPSGASSACRGRRRDSLSSCFLPFTNKHLPR
mmetsp:Transcript_10630/g.28343  ORF Transcript_10630/g.28343 Transcript_10630/m.28343 type:complete len:220 (+) Transcript_10630:839-1498(+)